MCCHRVILYIFFLVFFFFVFCLWLGISRILKEPRKTIFALNTRRGFPAHSSNKAADWSLGRTLNGPNNRRKTLITIGWSVVCHWPWMCMVCVCFLFIFFSFLCFTSAPNDLGSFNEENDSLVARALSNLELTRNIFFTVLYKYTRRTIFVIWK